MVRGSTFAIPLATTFTTFIPILGSSGGCLGLLAFSLLPLVFVTLSFLYVTFDLVVTTFATVTTGDGTPEMVLMGHSFPIFSVLLSFHLQHTTTAVVAVWGMTRSLFVIYRFTAERRVCTCFRFDLVHGTQVTLPLPPPWSALVEFLGPFPSPRLGVGVPPQPKCFLRNFSTWVSFSLSLA